MVKASKIRANIVTVGSLSEIPPNNANNPLPRATSIMKALFFKVARNFTIASFYTTHN
jgi:hypothetical protein